MLAALLLFLALGTAPIRPDPTLTPGAVLTTDARVVCVSGYAGRVRNVSDATKRAVYAAYRMQPSGKFERSKSGKRYWQSNDEVDHLISLQLGGDNSLRNLWVESYLTQPYNAWKKDQLENRLHWLVCHGTLPLKQAQTEIATDWVAAYDRYVRPKK